MKESKVSIKRNIDATYLMTLAKNLQSQKMIDV